jgi:hypothetical protein
MLREYYDAQPTTIRMVSCDNETLNDLIGGEYEWWGFWRSNPIYSLRRIGREIECELRAGYDKWILKVGEKDIFFMKLKDGENPNGTYISEDGASQVIVKMKAITDLKVIEDYKKLTAKREALETDTLMEEPEEEPPVVSKTVKKVLGYGPESVTLED